MMFLMKLRNKIFFKIERTIANTPSPTAVVSLIDEAFHKMSSGHQVSNNSNRIFRKINLVLDKTTLPGTEQVSWYAAHQKTLRSTTSKIGVQRHHVHANQALTTVI